MTRVKVKRPFASKSSAPPRAAHRQHHHGVPEDDEEPHQDAPYVYKRRKRDSSSSAAPHLQRRDSFSNSAHETSSSQDSSSSGSDEEECDEYGYHKNVYPADPQRAGNGSFPRPRAVDIRAINRLPPQRGGVLLKVKPSGDCRNEFHERSQGNWRANEGYNRGPWHSESPHESFSTRDRSVLTSHSRQSEEASFSNDHYHVPLQRQSEFQKRSDSVAVEELNSALTVIRKIMKMDAAEPFNEPVDPYALGIPDYFDVVKNPMDLGTICKRLEKGGHYRNSQGVYEDVQLVWANCRTYNQKGDPILDLMSRVKKNFMKYWTAAGLYTEKHQGQEADKGRFKTENAEKCLPKKEPDLHITPGKARRASGTGHHKADCSCVVCTGVRRKLAREGKLVDSPAGSGSTMNGTPAREKTLPRVKQEPNMDSDHGVTDRKGDATSNDISGDEVEDGPTNKTELVKVESTPQPKRGRPLGSTKALKLEREAAECSPAEDTDAEMEDMEMDVGEDGVRFYPASYEMPLRKIQPTVLHMGQKLFGTNSTWNRSISVWKNRSHNPILGTVSLLLSSKGAGC